MASLGIDNAPESWREHWQGSQISYEQVGVEFVEDSYIDSVNRALKLDPEALAALREAAVTIWSDDELSRLAWHWHFEIFHTIPLWGEELGQVGGWPNPDARMGDLAPMFPAVIAASGIPHMRGLNASRGIPEVISEAPLADLNIWLLDHKAKYGSCGLKQLVWLLFHLTGRLYQLGRLQFVAGTSQLPVRVFRNASDGRTIAVSEPGIRYRADGQVDGLNGIADPDAWTSELEITDYSVRGNPIDPLGSAHPEAIELQMPEWSQVLAPGDGIIEVHIYAGGKLDYDACRDSFAQAREFFPRYFPDAPFAGFTCQSWLLDPNLERILPSESNLVRFGRLFQRVPVPGGDWQTFERVFGVNKPDDLSALPRDTALRRAVLDHIENGNQMWFAGGFILK